MPLPFSPEACRRILPCSTSFRPFLSPQTKRENGTPPPLSPFTPVLLPSKITPCALTRATATTASASAPQRQPPGVTRMEKKQGYIQVAVARLTLLPASALSVWQPYLHSDAQA